MFIIALCRTYMENMYFVPTTGQLGWLGILELVFQSLGWIGINLVECFQLPLPLFLILKALGKVKKDEMVIRPKRQIRVPSLLSDYDPAGPGSQKRFHNPVPQNSKKGK